MRMIFGLRVEDVNKGEEDTMHNFIIICLSAVVAMSSEVLVAQSVPHIFNLESNTDHKVSWPYLLNNLQTYFRVEIGEAIDPKLSSLIEKRFSKVVASIDSKYKDREWTISHQYWLKSIPDILFFEVSDSKIIDSAPFDIAYNQANDSLYLLNYMTKEQIGTMIPPAEFSLSITPQILDYCRLFTLLKYPAASVRFVSSIEEIQMEAIYAQPGFYDLDNVKQGEMIKIDIPSIKGLTKLPVEGSTFLAEDTVDVSFYMARDNQIVMVKMALSKTDVLSYETHVVSKTINWHAIKP